MIIVVGDTPSSIEINAGGRIGDPSKMAAAQYVSSNRPRQSMGHLPIYVYGFRDRVTVHLGVKDYLILNRSQKNVMLWACEFHQCTDTP